MSPGGFCSFRLLQIVLATNKLPAVPQDTKDTQDHGAIQSPNGQDGLDGPLLLFFDCEIVGWEEICNIRIVDKSKVNKKLI